MEQYKVDNTMIKFYGNSNGHNNNKFNRVVKIAKRYELIKGKINRVLREEVDNNCSTSYCHAVAFNLLLSTGIRVGNEDSAEGYISELEYSDNKGEFVQTFGLTTIKSEHVSVNKDGSVSFDFLGKKQVANSFKFDLYNSTLIKKVLDCGYNPVFNTNDYEFTKFVKNKSAEMFSTKDFRTFRANVYAYLEIIKYPQTDVKKEAKQYVKNVVEAVSIKLNNTPGVVKSSYVDPNLFLETFPILKD